MHQSRGAVSFTPLFTTDDIGLRKDASVEHVVKVFLVVGEAMAARWIEMPRGILLLQAVPDQPASGAIRCHLPVGPRAPHLLRRFR
jgi:hypothetical protein